MGLDLDQLGAVDVLDEDTHAGRDRAEHAAHAALSRLDSRADRATEESDGRRRRASCWPRRTRAMWSAWRRCCASTRFLIGWAAASRIRRRNHARRSQLSGRRSARAGHRAHAACRGRELSRREPDRLRRQRSLRRGRRRGASRAEAIEDRGVCLRLPRPGRRRLRGPRGARHRAVPGPEGDRAGRARRRVHDSGVRRAGQALRSAHAPRSDSEVPLDRHGAGAGAEQARLAAVGQDQGARAQGHAGHGRRAAQALCRAAHRAGHGLLEGQRVSARVRRLLRLQRDRRSARGDPRHQVRHGVANADGPAAVRRRGLRQNRSGHARGLQGRAGRQAGRGAHADDGA